MIKLKKNIVGVYKKEIYFCKELGIKNVLDFKS